MLEQHATNTYQNVKFVDEILRDRRWTRILLVSSPYHMRRALMVWKKQAPEVEVVPTPVQQSQFYDHGRGANLEQVRGIIQEYLAILGLLAPRMAVSRLAQAARRSPCRRLPSPVSSWSRASRPGCD